MKIIFIDGQNERIRIAIFTMPRTGEVVIGARYKNKYYATQIGAVIRPSTDPLVLCSVEKKRLELSFDEYSFSLEHYLVKSPLALLLREIFAEVTSDM